MEEEKQIIEWGFDVPCDQVDLEKIWNQLQRRSVLEVLVYLGQLAIKAPIVCQRFTMWIKQNKRHAGCINYDYYYQIAQKHIK